MLPCVKETTTFQSSNCRKKKNSKVFGELKNIKGSDLFLFEGM